MDINKAYFNKKRKLNKRGTFSQIKRVETLLRFNLSSVSDLLFKLHLNGESAKSIELTNSLLMNISDVIKALKLLKSGIKRD